jgi:uncharacterized protein YcbK (DUF882 family)
MRQCLPDQIDRVREPIILPRPSVRPSSGLPTTLFALLLLALSGCAAGRPPPVPPPEPETGRTIVVRHPWDGDAAHVVYRRGAVYQDGAMREIASVFRDRRSGAVHPVEPALVDLLWDLRAALGLPEDHPIHIVSGYRSSATNASSRRKSRAAANSLHMEGRAADIRIPGVTGAVVARAARDLGRGGWAHYRGSDHVHVDTGPVRTWRTR